MTTFNFTSENVTRVFNAFIEDRRDLRALASAVVAQMGSEDDPDTLRELCECQDAGAGVSGFIYYSDTCKFYRENRADILAQLHSDADDFGEDVIRMCAGFRCFDGIEYDDIARALYSDDEDGDEWTTLANGFAWYAYETIAHAFESFMYDYEDDEDTDDEDDDETAED